jgi:hypothetical protein
MGARLIVNPTEERSLAEEGLAADIAAWPEYRAMRTLPGEIHWDDLAHQPRAALPILLRTWTDK